MEGAIGSLLDEVIDTRELMKAGQEKMKDSQEKMKAKMDATINALQKRIEAMIKAGKEQIRDERKVDRKIMKTRLNVFSPN